MASSTWEVRRKEEKDDHDEKDEVEEGSRE